MNSLVFLVVALLAPAHSRSEGSSTFQIVNDNQIQITIQLLSLDLPELCNVDISVSDEIKRKDQLRQLQLCTEKQFSSWFKIRSQDELCSIAFRSVTVLEQLQVTMSGTANCPNLSGQLLTIDWGLFRNTELDHFSTATIQFPDDTKERFVFSRRQNKFQFQMPTKKYLFVIFAIISTLALLLFLKRRKH